MMWADDMTDTKILSKNMGYAYSEIYLPFSMQSMTN